MEMEMHGRLSCATDFPEIASICLSVLDLHLHRELVTYLFSLARFCYLAED